MITNARWNPRVSTPTLDGSLTTPERQGLVGFVAAVQTPLSKL